MKTLITLLALACTSVTGKEKHNPLDYPRGEYTFNIGIRIIGKMRDCTVYVHVSEALLDALNDRDDESKIPCLVLNRTAQREHGVPTNPYKLRLTRSQKDSHLKGYVMYEVFVPYDLLYKTDVDIQAMEFQMLLYKPRKDR